MSDIENTINTDADTATLIKALRSLAHEHRFSSDPRYNTLAEAAERLELLAQIDDTVYGFLFRGALRNDDVLYSMGGNEFEREGQRIKLRGTARIDTPDGEKTIGFVKRDGKIIAKGDPVYGVFHPKLATTPLIDF